MLIKTILYHDGEQTVVIFDTDKPMWEQEVKVVEPVQNSEKNTPI